MKRREVLVATIAAGSLAGCLDNGLSGGVLEELGSPIGDDFEGGAVKHTPTDIDAEYTAIEFSSHEDAPSLADDDQMLLTDTEAVEAELADDDEIRDSIQEVDFDESYVVISKNRIEGEVTDLTVKDIKETTDGLQFEVQFEKDHMPGDSDAVEVIVIVVTTERRPPESVRVEWFEPVRCESEYTPYHRLPTPVKREVDIALADGVYETDGTLLYPQAALESATLWKDDEYYEPTITEDNRTATLQFESAENVTDQPAKLYLANSRSDAVEMTISVSTSDEILISEEVTLEPVQHLELTASLFEHESFRSIELTDEYGEYELSAETSDGELLDKSFTIDPEHDDRILALFEDSDRYDAVEFYSAIELEDRDISKPIGTCVNAGGWWGYPGE